MPSFYVNGQKVHTEEKTDLLSFLRDTLHITSVKCGCGQGACGTCCAVIDGKLKKTCTVFTDTLEGCSILTTEGLSEREKDVYAYAFAKEGAVQCGYCLPSMVMAAKVLLDSDPFPSEQMIRKALRYNMCRCTGYAAIIRAVRLAGKIFGENLPVPEEKDFSIGAESPRIDAREKILGAVKFVADDVPEGSLYGRAVLSGVKHALAKRIDVSAALALPGVKAVLTAKDVPGRVRTGPRDDDWRVLVGEGEEILFNGDVIALIAADSMETALKAESLINFEYEKLPEICTLSEAVAGGKMFLNVDFSSGDMAEARKNTAYVVTNSYKAPYAEHAFLETEAAAASYDGKILTVKSADQGIFRTRDRISKALDIPEENVVVEGYPVGGAFGGREDVLIQIQASLLAFHCRQSVFLQYTREQSLRIHAKRHEMSMVVTTACDRDGYLTYLDLIVLANKGAYASMGGPVLTRACALAPGPYKYQAVRVNGKSFFSNNTPSGSYRGFGITQCCFAVESNLTILAERAGISPWQIRYINALRPGDKYYNGQTADDSTAIAECLESVKDVFEKEPYAGIACAIKNSASGHDLKDVGRCSLLVKDGRIRILCSAGRVGQGIETALVQVVSDTAGISPDLIDWETADTGTAPDTGTCSASRLMMLAGEAAFRASCTLKAALEQSPLQALDGKCFAGEYRSETSAAGPVFHEAYSYACHVAVLDENGNVKKIVAAHDVGRAVNPLNIRGQIEGGVIMSLGYALTEHFTINEEKYFAKIGIPTSLNSPPVECHIIEKTDEKRRLKAKGVGEITAIPTPAALAMAYKKYDGKERFSLPLRESWLWIDPDKCVGCSLCVRNCPKGAIDAALIIDNTLCCRCDTCIRHCWFGAISERFDENTVHYHSHRSGAGPI